MTHSRPAAAAFGAGLSLLLWQASPAAGETASMPAAKPPARTATAKCDPATFRVVVDVGHSADVPGAKSARGAFEYGFNLQLAKTIERDLLAAGFDRTALLITDEPPRRGLVKRVTYAAGLSADLFLSIHHDSVPDRFLEPWTYEGEERHFCDRFRGHSLFISNDNVARNASLAFARLLGLQLKARGLQYTPHYKEAFMGSRRRELLDAEAGVYRYDQLIVLKNARMPAVLLEAGSIVHREEELLLMTPEHQATISAAVADAVKAFCAVRARPPAHFVRRPPAAAAPGGAAPVAGTPVPARAASQPPGLGAR